MISVIVPVYNAEDYLEEAILSVFSQTYKDWELILVDDGSSDSSPAICDKAALCSTKIRVKHIPNGGVSHARNVGLDMAKGDFITFIDADDLLAPNAFETMLALAEENDAEVVCGIIFEFKSGNTDFLAKSDDKPNSYIPSHIIKKYTAKEAAIKSLYQDGLDNAVCGKLYSSRLWQSLRFKESLRYEDLEICYKVFLSANNIIAIPTPLYYYRQHPGSYIHTFTPKRADALVVTEDIVEYSKTHCPELLPAARSRQLSANFNIFGLIAANGMTQDPEAAPIADACWQKIKELRADDLRNPNVRLKNKIGIMVSYLLGRKGLELLSKFVYRS